MSLAILHTVPSCSSLTGQEALECGLAFSSLELTVGLFFQGDGVWQLRENQTPELYGFKNHTKTYSALEFYDIESVFACKESMLQRRMTLDDCVIPVQLLSLEEFHQQLLQFAQILKF